MNIVNDESNEHDVNDVNDVNSSSSSESEDDINISDNLIYHDMSNDGTPNDGRPNDISSNSTSNIQSMILKLISYEQTDLLELQIEKLSLLENNSICNLKYNHIKYDHIRYRHIKYFIEKHKYIAISSICDSLICGTTDHHILKYICWLIDLTIPSISIKFLNTLSRMLQYYGKKYQKYSNDKIYALILIILQWISNKIPQELCAYKSMKYNSVIVSVFYGIGPKREDLFNIILDVYEKYNIPLPFIEYREFPSVKGTILYLAVTYTNLDVIRRILSLTQTIKTKTVINRTLVKYRASNSKIFLEPIFASILTNFSHDNIEDIQKSVVTFNLLIEYGFNPFTAIISGTRRDSLKNKKQINEKHSILYYIEYFGWKNTEIYDIVVNYRTNLILSLVMNKMNMNHIIQYQSLKNLVGCYF